MMKNLFDILPQEFFKPLTSKYKREYMDCICLIYNTYQTELSYGVDREIIVSILESYFEEHAGIEIVFDEQEEIPKDSRAKANAVIRVLKEYKWIEYETVENYTVQVVLLDYAATTIEAFNKIIKEDEMEYQSVISQIHATLLNKEAYKKPYEYILKRVGENTEELISGLKKLNISIKKYIDQQTDQMTTREILEHFFQYHQEIGSKAYLRMKTSDNISYFRNSIIENLNNILFDQDIMNKAVEGYMEVEQVKEKDKAEGAIRALINKIKSAFNNMDNIINEIDRKHVKYQQSAITRAKFLLASGNNTEGKILQILSYLAEQFNEEDDLDLGEVAGTGLLNVFNIFPQKFIDNESLKTIKISKKLGVPEEIDDDLQMSEEERAAYRKQWKEKNKNRFTRKNINEYVQALLKDKKVIAASSLPLNCKRDLIRIIFISLYGRNTRSSYSIETKEETIAINGFEFKDFNIMRR